MQKCKEEKTNTKTCKTDAEKENVQNVRGKRRASKNTTAVFVAKLFPAKEKTSKEGKAKQNREKNGQNDSSGCRNNKKYNNVRSFAFVTNMTHTAGKQGQNLEAQPTKMKTKWVAGGRRGR